MKKYKIVFICHFSSSEVRDRLILKRHYIRTFLSKFFLGFSFHYHDFAIWVSDYISEFEKHPEFEFHVISPHKGMEKSIQSYSNNGINYHFFCCDGSLAYDFINAKFLIEEKNGYKRNRKKINKIINSIHPDLIVLCGAENPYYSMSVLDINDIPVYVILQTLLNDQKRIEMKVGSASRREVELDIFRHANYFCTSGDKIVSVINKNNNRAVILPAGFPTHRPVLSRPLEKDGDFVFFAKSITVNKGIEDLLRALYFVKKKHNDVVLSVIGGCSSEYRKHLDNLIYNLGVKENVRFLGYFDSINETYSNVIRYKAATVPGITAGLNSTVRESMLMGLPTICYNTAATEEINKQKRSIITAAMENVDDLSRQMLFVLEKPEDAGIIAKNGLEYANSKFGNEGIVNKFLENCQLIIEGKV